MNQFIITKCVTCGRSREVEIEEISVWYKKHHPALNVGDPVPTKCLDCWKEFEKGQSVRLRLSYGDLHLAKVNDVGCVKNVYSSSSGIIYEVEFVKGKPPELFTQIELAPIT